MMATKRRRHSRPAADDQVDSALEVELDVTNVAHGGVFVARHEGRVVFVADTLPGERVLARVSDTRHKSFWRAETLGVVQAAPERREHVWREASVDRPPLQRAGGAEFGHIVDAHQRELKRQVLTDALSRFGGIDSEVVVEPVDVDGGAKSGTGWRTRVRLQVSPDGVLGPFAARSHAVVPVESLPLASPDVAAIAPLSERFAGVAHIDVVAPSDDTSRLLVSERDARGRPGADARATVHERVGARRFALDAGGFWQLHRNAAGLLSSAVQNAVDPELFDPRAANLDLYGGVGLLAAALADRFGDAVRITSVESDERATEHAGENLAEWAGASAVSARVERYLSDLIATASGADRRRFDAATVVLDPPRSGAGRKVVDALSELSPRQVVYVACDPVALARDTGLLRERGYGLIGIRAFDLFPNTHHLEAVASFTRL